MNTYKTGVTVTMRIITVGNQIYVQLTECLSFLFPHGLYLVVHMLSLQPTVYMQISLPPLVVYKRDHIQQR